MRNKHSWRGIQNASKRDAEEQGRQEEGWWCFLVVSTKVDSRIRWLALDPGFTAHWTSDLGWITKPHFSHL